MYEKKKAKVGWRLLRRRSRKVAPIMPIDSTQTNCKKEDASEAKRKLIEGNKLMDKAITEVLLVIL